MSNFAAKIGKRRLRALSLLLMGMVVAGGALTGVASPADDQANVVYVVSRSGSMGASGGACGTKLACVKAAVTAANAAARGSVGQTGLAISNLAGAARDVDFGARGNQYLVGPGYDGNRNGRADLADAAHRLSLGGATCYACGLDGAQTILDSSASGARNVIVFVADRPNQVGPALSSIGSFDSNTVIRAIAVGPQTTCGPTRLKVGRGGRTEVAVASLAPVATLTSGGTCTHVSGFGSLAEAVASATG